MKVELWGTRGSIPSPGPETIRYGGNTSCVGVTLSDGSMLALDAGTGIRSLGLALADEPTRLHILLTHLHLDHIQGLVFFAPAFRPQTEIVIWGPASPEASLRDRIARYISAPLSPVEVRELPCDVSFRHCPRERVGDRLGADQRRLRRPPRADARLPDRRRRLLARLHPRPRARPRRRPRHARGRLDLRLRPRPRRLVADPRRPVRRRRVPRPRRLGPLVAFARALLRPPRRSRADGALPPRPDALRRASRPARQKKRAQRWTALGGSPDDDRARRRASRIRVAGASGQRDFRNLETARFTWFDCPLLPATLARGMTSAPGIDAAVERSDLVREALATAQRAHAGQTPRGSDGRPFIDHPVAVAELLVTERQNDEVLAAALLHDVVEKSEIESRLGPRALRRDRRRAGCER